ncbi:Oligopeptide transporter OPT superfamily [Metarhizium guizhouense ARSEF 977]|uniref:Oligopeptide transporter OPT superfamily n=1 Tax=Metarhizium guizhouense (strain ARSEF 977) TaxID=1276136 RepID=A0A0B4GM79_METGA|nr:Oligopeptide transporter OPT superfamily [Metarhizium guizhouense ARSEF 977]
MAPGQLDEPLSDAVAAQPTVVTEDAAAAVGVDEKAGPQIAADQHSDSLSKDAENNGARVLYNVVNANGEEEAVSEDDPRVRDIPPYVRRIVSFKDDTTEPTLTFRYFLLTILFVAPGAFLSQMAHFRTTYAPYSVFFVQIASNYVGVWLAKVLPAWRVRIPLTRYGFSLNPGPFSTKEHVLVTISAASGATYNLGYTPISMSELYFGERVNGAVAVFFMLAITWTGYSYAALARQFLIYDPQYPWFQALCQTALFETQKKQRENPSRLSSKQMRVFFGVLVAVILWQFLPEFVFPMLGSLAFLCWVAPRSPVANFVGAGFGGMGFLNLSLDWSSIASGASLFLTPWWTQVIMFVAFAVNCWVLLPAAKWGNLASWNHGLMSNRVFLENGTRYPLSELLTPDMRLNTTAYAQHGDLYVGAQYLWNMFFDYAAYASALVWMALFGFRQVRASVEKFLERRTARDGRKVTEQYDDQINVLQRPYDEIPFWWFAALFAVSLVIMVVICARGLIFIPVWTYFVGIATGAVVVVPLGWLYALSNFQLAIGSTNELLYGLMINAVSGWKNPCGASAYGSVAGDAWYRAQLNLQDMKIGHYMHVPPKAVFFSQIFGSLIGIPIDYAVIRWVLDTKFDYLAGVKEDPTHQWTGQSLASSLTLGVQYVLVGPRRLFQQHLFKVVPYGFLVGAAAPVVLFLLHKKFPRAKFNLFNTTIFFSSMSTFYGNISTGYFSSFLGGFVVMFWCYRYKYELWARWNYMLAAAFDAGFNFNMLLIFLCFGAGKIVNMPHWWGNNADSSERCFALDS